MTRLYEKSTSNERLVFVLMVVRRMNLKIIVSVIVVVMVVDVVFLKLLVTNLVSLACFVTTGEKWSLSDL